jgi:hypothetical protein
MVNTMKSRTNGVNSEGVYAPDELIVVVEIGKKLTVASGAGVLTRGTVLGKIASGAATAVAKSGGNTGNGTISAVTIQNPDKVGVYSVRFTAATVFTVEDPDGFVLAVNGATGAAFADDLGFTITAGGTPFVAGDGFDITVAAGSGKVTAAQTASKDGSQTPYAILAEDVDATSADADAMVYMAGTFNSNFLVYGTGHSLATVFDPLRMVDIHLVAGLAY